MRKIGIIFAVVMLAGGIASAQTLTVLYTFQGGVDGGEPAGRLTLDAQGNLYGATTFGGYLNRGEVFKFAGGVKTRVHSFRGGNDGYSPNGGLILDAAGNLYGTTFGGGSGGDGTNGTVFRISPAGVKLILFKFNGVDGSMPESGVTMDASGNLYGTTYGGGANGYGTVYQLTPQANGFYIHKVIYQMAFRRAVSPFSQPAIDAAGNVYVTASGGSYGQLLKLSKNANGTWDHHFVGKFGPEYAEPIWGVTIDASGNIYGTDNHGYNNSGGVWELTSGGQFQPLQTWFDYSDCPTGTLALDAAGDVYGETNGGLRGWGAVFKISPVSGYQVLWEFDVSNPYPLGGVVMDGQGNLYGVTWGDGRKTFGTIFEVTP